VSADDLTTAPQGPVDESAERALSDALGRLATTPRLLVALDFDGTLAPEVDAPMEARALPEALDAIRRLVAMDATTVALVSGRDISSLLQIADVPEEVVLVGSHGIEVRIDGETTTLTDDEQARRAVISEVLHTTAEGREGVYVEEKPAGLALHTRLADAATTEEVRAAVQQRLAAEPGVHEREGKNVREYAVRPTGKDDGVARLREHYGATGVLYAGDDVTDEDALGSLGDGDLGVKVGPAETVAAHRVTDAEAVARLLTALADLREHLGHA
jgi:trehalose 6-phosphate phosphatase